MPDKAKQPTKSKEPDKGSQKVVRWECQRCGYIHTGPEPPEVCPVCGAPTSEFKRLE